MRKVTQVDLMGKEIIISEYYKLSTNYYKLLEVFVNNECVKFNVDTLSKCFLKNLIMSRVTILRFLRDMQDLDYISEVAIIEVKKTVGNKIQKKLMYEDGKPVIDRRRKYYRITTKGIEVFEKQ